MGDILGVACDTSLLSKKSNLSPKPKCAPQLHIYSLNNYLLKIYCVLGTVLGPGHVAEHITDQGIGLI